MRLPHVEKKNRGSQKIGWKSEEGGSSQDLRGTSLVCGDLRVAVTRVSHDTNTISTHLDCKKCIWRHFSRWSTGCSLLPVPRTEEQRRRRRRISKGHCFSFLWKGRLRSQEEEDFFILSERNTSSFSFSRIRRIRLLHSQEEEHFISSKRRTLLDLVSHLSRVRPLPFLWLQRQFRCSLKKLKAVKTPQLCWCSSSIKL